MHRLFLLNGKLHPAWRAAGYFVVLLPGLITLDGLLGLIWFAAQPLPAADSAALVEHLAAITAQPAFLLASALTNLSWALLLAGLGLRWLDRAPLLSLGWGRTNMGRDVLLGLALGCASMAVVFLVFRLLGWVRVDGWAVLPRLDEGLTLTGALIAAAAFEEIMFRGYPLRTLLEWRGWPLSLVVTSTLFGLVHLGNPSVSGLAVFNIALAGAAFGLSLKVAGRLWLPIAYHFAWNFAQGPLLGLSVSGLNFPTLLRTTLTGPALWTGGAFGPEGGLVVTLLLLASIGLLWAWDRRAAAAA